MSDLIEIESLARLNIQAGEVLVARFPESLSEWDVRVLAARIKDSIPAGIRLMVLHGDIELSVLAKGDDDAADDEEA